MTTTLTERELLAAAVIKRYLHTGKPVTRRELADALGRDKLPSVQNLPACDRTRLGSHHAWLPSRETLRQLIRHCR